MLFFYLLLRITINLITKTDSIKLEIVNHTFNSLPDKDAIVPIKLEPNTTKTSHEGLTKGPFPCTKCPKKFRSFKGLFRHMLKHEGEGDIPCPLCPYKTNRRKLLSNHFYNRHSSNISCQKCGKDFASRPSLRDHVKVAHEDTNKCSICSKVFLKEGDLVNHSLKEHKKKMKFNCPQCAKSFEYEHSLTYHERAHQRETIFSSA